MAGITGSKLENMGSVEHVQKFLSLETGLATVSTIQMSGGILSSVVNCGVLPHPITQKTLRCLRFSWKCRKIKTY